MIWIRCPLMAAINVEKEGKIKIGWTMAKVEMMARRPLQCCRCWEFGHVQFTCKAKVDRMRHCFNCGHPGHSVKECENEEPRCVICDEKGFPANHKIDSRFCELSKTLERKRQQSRGRVGADKGEKKTPKGGRIGRTEEEQSMEHNNDL